MVQAKDEHKDRLAQALRANLRRRKAQAREGAGSREREAAAGRDGEDGPG